MSNTTSFQRTFLKDIEVEVQIGLHPWEQHPERPTRLLITVELFSNVLVSFTPAIEHGFVDYDVVRKFIRTFEQRPHIALIEELIHDLVALCMKFDQLTGCRVSIRKPDIFNEVDEAGVEVFLTRDEYLTRAQQN
jgi:dihydroneopterin aldolase